MDEANKLKEEDTDVGLTTPTLADTGARPEVRPVATPSLRAGGGSSAGTPALAVDQQVAPFFSADESTRTFAARGAPSKLILLTSLGRWWSRRILLLPRR